jgi:hypothetical protein
VWLPDTHPVFQVPPRQRAAKLREWLDLALRLDDHLRAIREAVEGVREAVESGRCGCGASPGEPAQGDRAAGFLAAFEEWQ